MSGDSEAKADNSNLENVVDVCQHRDVLELLGINTIVSVEQENSKDPGDIGKLVLSPRAPTKKTKSKQAPMGTAHLNDKNKSDLMTAGVVASQSQQMALLQRQSAGMF